MAAQTLKCPRCGHENVSRALFCFQCGRDLGELPTNDGSTIAGSDGVRLIKDRPQSAGGPIKKPKPEGLSGEPITCLRCGAYNRPDSGRCHNCRNPLFVPDEDFNLMARPFARTNMGSVRHNNEDNLNLWAIDGITIALIADGMGGAAAGEEASRLTVEAVQADFLGERRGSTELNTLSENDLSKRLSDAIRDANRAVLDKTLVEPQYKGMGTTSTLAMIRANRVIVAHVGDSRAYHINGKTHEITQITNDHSFVQALVASGHITAEQAVSHPMGNVLYRALGQGTDLDVDIYTRFVKAGDRIVLCSDGLTRHLKASEIAHLVIAEPTPASATQKMIELANARGGEDNISVIVIKLIDEESDETLPHKPNE